MAKRKQLDLTHDEQLPPLVSWRGPEAVSQELGVYVPEGEFREILGNEIVELSHPDHDTVVHAQAQKLGDLLVRVDHGAVNPDGFFQLDGSYHFERYGSVRDDGYHPIVTDEGDPSPQGGTVDKRGGIAATVGVSEVSE